MHNSQKLETTQISIYDSMGNLFTEYYTIEHYIVMRMNKLTTTCNTILTNIGKEKADTHIHTRTV